MHTYEQLAQRLRSATNHPFTPPEIIPDMVQAANTLDAMAQSYREILKSLIHTAQVAKHEHLSEAERGPEPF